jgi:hypothetical protein
MTDDNSKSPGYPSVMGILGQLHEAGSRGRLSRELALSFRPRQRGLHATQVEVNTALAKLREAGHVRRGAPEPSPHYHHGPAFRWRITARGRAYFLAGGTSGLAAAARAAREQHELARGEDARQRAAALERARQQAATALGCTRVRNQLIHELREAGLTLTLIGDLFGITRERARQVLAGIHVKRRCRCARCRQELPESPVTTPQ